MRDKVKVVNVATGEIYEYDWSNDAEQAMAYDGINQTIKALERARDKIKKKVLAEVDDRKRAGDYEWRIITRNYMNYDISVLRHEVDEDLFNQLVKPNKTAIDELIKEAVAAPTELKDISLSAAKQLRDTMIKDKKPSIALKLERITDGKD